MISMHGDAEQSIEGVALTSFVWSAGCFGSFHYNDCTCSEPTLQPLSTWLATR
jgi:hypothetical protein